eukprot:g6951.t1
MSPPDSAQMSPTRPVERCKHSRESGRSAEGSPGVAATAARLRRDEQQSPEEKPRSRPRRRGVGAVGRQRPKSEVARTARQRECGGGGGGGGGGRRRGTRKRPTAGLGVTKTRAVPLALAAASCAHQGLLGSILPGMVVHVHAELRPETELTSNCFDFPENNFDRGSCIMAVNGGNTPYLPLETGGDAIDFTLHDLEGRPWNLGEALEQADQPVVMIFGMWTCPAFQGYGTTPPWDMSAYWNERELVEAYKGQATFVHVYGPEPHPSTPGTNFDKGIMWQNYWSVLPQQKTYGERVATAERIVDMIHPAQKILVDYLPGNRYSELIQPVWCSYAMGARPVTVITPDGKVFFQRGWFHSKHVAGALEEYSCLRERQQQQQQQQEQEGVSEQLDEEPDSGCSPSEGGDIDLGGGGSPPLAGVPPGSVAPLPPWLR